MAFKLRRLPHQDLQGLSSLHFSELCVQLQPADALSGVVTTSAQVKQLKLHRCHLLDGEKGLAAALVLLPKLQHLSLVHNYQPMPITSLPSNALPALQQLTYLELAGKVFQVCLLVLPFCNWGACCLCTVTLLAKCNKMMILMMVQVISCRIQMGCSSCRGLHACRTCGLIS